MALADAVAIGAAVAAAVAALLLLAGSRRSATGWLLLATAAGLLWWLAPEPDGAVLFTLSLVFGGSAPTLAAAAGSVWPAGRLGRLGRLTVAGAVACAVLVGGLLPTLVFDPVAAGCNACPRNLLEVADGPAEALWRTAEASALAWGPALAGLAGWRLRRAPQLVRRHAWPMLGAAVAVGVLAAVSAVHELRLPVGEVDDTVTAIRVAIGLLVTLMAAGIVIRAVLVRTAGRRMARSVLAAISEPAAVVDSLRRTVADPGLGVAFHRLEGGTVDADSVPVPASSGQAVLRLERERAPFAEIRYDARLAGSVDLVRAAVSSAGLALEYLAAQARLRAEVRDIVALRARIVADGDAERRRLERNLHDGAQQQLVALGLMLATGANDRDAAVAHAEIDAALHELRALAHGLFPAALGEDGVAAALRELGDHTTCPLLVDGDVRGEVPRAVAMAVYQLVVDVTDASSASLAVRVRLDGGGGEPARVTVETSGSSDGNPLASAVESPDDDPVRRRLIHAEDRFVAAGGRLSVTRSADVLVVEGTAPCVS